ncbi:M23 family metallopeptidase [Synechococcus sp. J7-Johnson]|uniref:M23 family metallopeptidase n=1 Tax=Synechococcus sp. J7-Johnson TaxID=2823737 RepID=UPI0020CE3C05|nr:M23 family metallopeptidase [Synechococcus sp. J7-Johnson]MCP9841839.1 M23 family metallopeptidase [Synechococcus sp. J7-Johnson]
MAPARSRLASALLLLGFLGFAASAAPINAAPLAEPLIPDSASGAGSEDDPWPEALLPPAMVAPTPLPMSAPTTSRPERPSTVPRVVPVGDLAQHDQPSGPGDVASRPPGPLHYPLGLAASEQDPWGWRYSSARGAWRMHTGVDLIAPEGTAVLAVKAGRVQRVDVIAGYGLTVLIDHGAGWSSLYAHLLNASVDPGESVRAGQPLGTVGQSGNASTPHLHLEMRQRQPQGLVAVDPTPLLPAPPPGGAIAGDIRP